MYSKKEIVYKQATWKQMNQTSDHVWKKENKKRMNKKKRKTETPKRT